MKKAPTRKQRPDFNFSESNLTSTTRKPKGKNHEKVLDELARKWVRYGCADTPSQALKMLLGQ